MCGIELLKRGDAFGYTYGGEEGIMRDRAYRREMEAKKESRLKQILKTCKPIPRVGHVKCGWVDGMWRPVKGAYVQYPKNSNIQKYLKRQTRRKVRRSEPFAKGNSYRKCMEYRWIFW